MNARRVSTVMGLLLLAGCSSIPADSYGVDRLELEGVEVMDPKAVTVCLATQARPYWTIQLGVRGTPTCGSPPFEGEPPRIRVWRWPWTDWPVYDEVVFERDLDRIIRWYQARGYVNARVVETRIEPPAADRSDVVRDDTECERDDDDEGCRVRITVVIDEGEPVQVTRVAVLGLDGLDASVAEAIRAAVKLPVGERFDEAVYDQAKAALERSLARRSFARATVDGSVRVDRDALTAEIELTVTPGPPCVFGQVTVEGNDDLPALPIREATLIEPGDPFSPQALNDAQNGVFDLGAFASTDVRPRIPDSGVVVDVVVRVVPARRTRFQVGVGVESGVIRQRVTDEAEQIPQWDVHLSGAWEHRNLFGGMRRFRVEDRPRMIFTREFPGAEAPKFGNVLSIDFRQPAFIEPRTTLVIDSRWELGPDPFLDIFRHTVDAGVGLERYFLNHRLLTAVGLREGLYLVPGSPTPRPGTEVPASSDLMFFEQTARLDLRNDPVRTRRGFFASLSLQEAGYILPSSWDTIRIVPEVRGYVPLPLGVVLAMRFAVGAIFVTAAESDLDPLSRQLGPTNQRLRGGGGTSNRGFPPGELGDGPDGGVRRWLAAAELRVPITRDFGVTLFADSGDVSRAEEFRFDHPQLSVGAGLRLITLIGAIRLDTGWRVPRAQVLAETDQRDPGGHLTDVDFGFVRFPGAINLILGDAF